MREEPTELLENSATEQAFYKYLSKCENGVKKNQEEEIFFQTYREF